MERNQNEIKMKELEILESELRNLKKGAKVYYQQPNSSIFFLSNKDKELARVVDGQFCFPSIYEQDDLLDLIHCEV